MELINQADLEDKIYHKGFPKELINGLKSAIDAGNTDIALKHHVKIKDDEVGYQLNFRYDPETQKGYFNSFDSAIISGPGIEGLRDHNFSDQQMITAMEAYRMLKHGTLVAVNKTLFNKEGQKYNTWLSLDITGKKDEYNNYPVNSYHENYYQKQPFIVAEELKKIPVPVKELQTTQSLETFEKALKKANVMQVTILHNNAEISAILVVNPKAGRIDLYNSDLKLIEGQQQNQKQTQQTADLGQAEEKKKSIGSQKVNWTKTQQSKGKSF